MTAEEQAADYISCLYPQKKEFKLTEVINILSRFYPEYVTSVTDKGEKNHEKK